MRALALALGASVALLSCNDTADPSRGSGSVDRGGGDVPDGAVYVDGDGCRYAVLRAELAYPYEVEELSALGRRFVNGIYASKGRIFLYDDGGITEVVNGELKPISEASASDVRLADFDDDGDDDLLAIEVGSASTSIVLMEQAADELTEPRTLIELESDLLDLAIADFDRQGWLDIAYVQQGIARMLVGRPMLQFEPRPTTGVANVIPQKLYADDVNGDDAIDLIGVYWFTAYRQGDAHDSFVGVSLGDDTGTLGPMRQAESLGTAEAFQAGDRLADLTGDRVSDLVIGWGRRLVLLRGRSDGGFEEPERLDIDFDNDVPEPLLADVDGDADIDIVLADDRVRVLVSDGEGGFTVDRHPVTSDVIAAAVDDAPSDGPAALIAISRLACDPSNLSE